MTQREFWKEIEARTSKEVADFGFDSINENDLPGTKCTLTGPHYPNTVNCADLAAAALAAQQAYEAHLELESEPRADAEGIARNTASNQHWLNACPAVVSWTERGEWIDFTYSRSVEVSACPPDVWFDPDAAPHAAR